MVYKDDLSNMRVDKSETLLANLVWFFMIGFVMVFFQMGASIIGDMPDGYEKVMSLIFTMFMVFKMLFWVGHPKIIFTSINKRKGTISKKTIDFGY